MSIQAARRHGAQRPSAASSRDGVLELALGLFLAVSAIAIIVDIPWLALLFALLAAGGWVPLQRRLALGGLQGEDLHAHWRWRGLAAALVFVIAAGLLDLAVSGVALHWWIRGDGLLRLGLALSLGLAVVAWSHRRPDFYGYAAGTAIVFVLFEMVGAGPVNALLVTGLGIAAGGGVRLAGFLRRKRSKAVRVPRPAPTSTLTLRFAVRATPERCFAFSTDPLRIPQWQPNVRAVRVHSHRWYDVVYSLGPFERSTPVEVIRSSPPELTVIQGRMPIGGRYTATTRLEAEDGLTRGTYTLEYRLPRSVRWLDRVLVRPNYRAYVRSAIARLTAVIESSA